MSNFTHNAYLSPFTWRYGSQAMRDLWGEIHRRKLWRQVWVALATAQSEIGLVTAEQLADLVAHQNDIDLDRAHQLETELHHDVMAEIRTYTEQCPVGGGIIHLGATSMDVLDNADVLRLREALDLIASRLRDVLLVLADCIEDYADVPTIAFTHLQPAEPTTIGYRLAQYGQDLLMDREQLQTVRRNLRGKGIKGAVGTSASYMALLEDTTLTPEQFEARVMGLLDLPVFAVTHQTYPRKQDWHIGNALAGIAGSLYKFAFDLRLLQSPLLGEWSEPFGEKQVGSSAMPFKRNPVKAENINSLGRWVAAQTSILWDNAAHALLERTLDDSGNRRIALAEIFLAVDEMLVQAKRILEGLQINLTAVERNLAVYGVFAAIEPLLMHLAKAGADRQAMHEHLREHSLRAWGVVQNGGANPLIEQLVSDDILLAYLSPDEIRSTMQSRSYLGDAPQRARQLAEQIRFIGNGSATQ
jgi:adenylosuccinate lyase